MDGQCLTLSVILMAKETEMYGKSEGSYDETLDHFGAGFGGVGRAPDAAPARDAREEVFPLVKAALRQRSYTAPGF
jgi:hypothetical protein